jgi:Tfp pilus assembly PilM family ATPase
MIYLYLDKNKIKLLALAKTILGQYNFSSFQKTHETDLLESGQVKNIDLLASAIKEALTLANPSEIKDKDVYLILPQQAFFFERYDVPSDISETAIIPFIKDKIRANLPLDIEELLYNYLLAKQNNQTKVLFFAQQKEIYKKYEETLKLLGLSLKAVIPETLAYFQLFEKTLRKEKKENIFYVFFETRASFGYIYDSFGLLKKEKYLFEDDIETSLKAKIEELAKENIKINRVILSGKESEKVRQDLFTKNVGAWTNPLKKIMANFYQDSLKLIITTPKNQLSFLDFDVCFGSFIFNLENKSFSFSDGQSVSKKRRRLPELKFNFSLKWINSHDLLIFLLAFVFSFISIFFISKFPDFSKLASKKISDLKPPTATPVIPTATPTPSLKKETLKIKVLNGAGIKGKASEVKDILKDKGYGEILTGNADSFDYEKTETQIKEEKKEVFNYLKKDLADYVNLEKKSSLAEDSASDIILTIGKDFK